MLKKYILLSWIVCIIIYFCTRYGYAKDAEDIPVNKGIILHQLSLLDKGIEKTKEMVEKIDNEKAKRMLQKCYIQRKKIEALIKENKFNMATLDIIRQQQFYAREIRKWIEKEKFVKKKLGELEKELKKRKVIIFSSDNKRARKLWKNAIKHKILAQKAIKGNKIDLANQYINISLRLSQQAVSFARGREKIKEEILHLKYMLKKAEQIVKRSNKDKPKLLLEEAKKIAEKAVRKMITESQYNTNYARTIELINLATKLIHRAIRAAGADIGESIKIEMQQLSILLSQTGMVVRYSNSKDAKRILEEAKKIARQAELAITSKKWKLAQKKIRRSKRLAKVAAEKAEEF
jgi:hypothetical protein